MVPLQAHRRVQLQAHRMAELQAHWMAELQAHWMVEPQAHRMTDDRMLAGPPEAASGPARSVEVRSTAARWACRVVVRRPAVRTQL